VGVLLDLGDVGSAQPSRGHRAVVLHRSELVGRGRARTAVAAWPRDTKDRHVVEHPAAALIFSVDHLRELIGRLVVEAVGPDRDGAVVVVDLGPAQHRRWPAVGGAALTEVADLIAAAGPAIRIQHRSDAHGQQTSAARAGLRDLRGTAVVAGLARRAAGVLHAKVGRCGVRDQRVAAGTIHQRICGRGVDRGVGG